MSSQVACVLVNFVYSLFIRYQLWTYENELFEPLYISRSV